MTDERASAAVRVDLDRVQEEVGAILATMSWTHAQLEELKAELRRWMSVATTAAMPNPGLIQQHAVDEDPLDHAIMAEHERVANDAG